MPLQHKIAHLSKMGLIRVKSGNKKWKEKKTHINDRETENKKHRNKTIRNKHNKWIHTNQTKMTLEVEKTKNNSLWDVCLFLSLFPVRLIEWTSFLFLSFVWISLLSVYLCPFFFFFPFLSLVCFCFCCYCLFVFFFLFSVLRC